jgi:HEAT repeat protein
MRTALIVGVAVLLLAQGNVSTQPARPVKKEPPKAKTKAPPSTETDPQPVNTGKKTFAGKTLQDWIRDLSHGDASRRTLALLAIMQPVFVEEAQAAVPAIIKRLHDTDLSPRAKACLALRVLEVKKEYVPDVIRGLATRLWYKNERDAIIRYEALVTVRRFAPDAAEAIPGLINCTLDRNSWEIRHMAAATLWRAARGNKEEGGTDPRAVAALLKMFRGGAISTYQERLEVVIGLGSLKKSSDPSLQAQVISTLENATLTRNPDNKPLAIWAAAGLVMQGDNVVAEKSLSAIAKYLKSENLEIRTQAVQALAALGKQAKSRLPAILAMLKDKEAVAVDGACMALVRMGDSSDRVTDALIKLSEHSDINRVGSAVVALANLKANKTRVIAALEKVIEREKDKPAKEVNPGLVKLVQDALEFIKKPGPKAANEANKVANPVRKVDIRKRPR